MAKHERTVAKDRMVDKDTGQLVAAAGDVVDPETLKNAAPEDQVVGKPYHAKPNSGDATSNLANDPKPLGTDGLIESKPIDDAAVTPGHHIEATARQAVKNKPSSGAGLTAPRGSGFTPPPAKGK